MRISTILLAAMTFSLSACGDDGGGTGSVTIDLQYPAQGRAEQNTSSVRIWVLSPAQEELRCAQLVAAETEPFVSRDFARLADVVFNVAQDTPPFTIEDVANKGRIFVYGEVVDYAGTTILAGCDDLPKLGEATLKLIRPRTFDCADPATANGAVCDDGLFCTVGETCSGGSCSSGGTRDCSFVEDDCNGSSCTEELGCQPVPAPLGSLCDDGNGCTLNEQCDGQGSCTPGTVDCTASDRGLCVVGTCDTDFLVCESIDSDTTVDTGDDSCSLLANIEVTDCYQLSQVDECNASNGRCNIQTLAVPPVSCTNQCRTGGTCSGTLCLGGTPVATPEEVPEVTCNDSRDNDCDNLIDCADSDCAASPDCQ
jgi:hypothetical protein